MATAIGGASGAWRLPNVEAIERDRTTEHLERATTKLEALRTRATETRARADEISRPHIDAARRSNRNENIGLAAAMAGMGALVLGGIGATSGPAGGRLMAGAIGALVGAAFGGGAAGVILQNSSTRPTEHQVAAWPQEVRDAIDDAAAAERAVPHTIGRAANPPLLSQISIASSWEPGATTIAGDMTVADFVVEHAGAFDHDDDGLVDVRAGSSELRRDVDGGPVGPGTEQIRHLHPFLAAGDTDGDERLSPEEAAVATVDEAITSRDYQWWAPPS